jgi:hypothetical protein
MLLYVRQRCLGQLLADPTGFADDSTIEVMYIAIHRSKDALLALAFFICMALVVFSTLIYFAERGVWDGTLGTFVDAEGVLSCARNRGGACSSG